MESAPWIVDHLVYCVRDLGSTIEWFHELSGIKPTIGGRHLTKGTKNALIYLGDKCYLEFLAIDEDNKDIQAPRWMGIDRFSEPKLTRWCLKSNNILEDKNILGTYSTELSILSQGERLTPNGDALKWKMTLPQSYPEVEVLPFLIDWSESAVHPADNLEQGCKLLDVKFIITKEEQLKRESLINFTTSTQISIGSTTEIAATIATPKAVITI